MKPNQAQHQPDYPQFGPDERRRSTRRPASLTSIATNFGQLSDSLKDAPVGPALRNLNTTLAEAQTVAERRERGPQRQNGLTRQAASTIRLALHQP
ncbi:MAG: hypothetical protein WKG07_49510 [Hymenobacter sp.]